MLDGLQHAQRHAHHVGEDDRHHAVEERDRETALHHRPNRLRVACGVAQVALQHAGELRLVNQRHIRLRFVEFLTWIRLLPFLLLLFRGDDARSPDGGVHLLERHDLGLILRIALHRHHIRRSRQFDLGFGLSFGKVSTGAIRVLRPGTQPRGVGDEEGFIMPVLLLELQKLRRREPARLLPAAATALPIALHASLQERLLHRPARRETDDEKHHQRHADECRRDEKQAAD
jgi:hypothetical protein